jgi:hypothetical protein
MAARSGANGDQVIGILKDLLFGRAAGSRFLLGSLPVPILHFALVEAHGGIVAEEVGVSTSALASKAAAGVADVRGS